MMPLYSWYGATNDGDILATIYIGHMTKLDRYLLILLHWKCCFDWCCCVHNNCKIMPVLYMDHTLKLDTQLLISKPFCFSAFKTIYKWYNLFSQKQIFPLHFTHMPYLSDEYMRDANVHICHILYQLTSCMWSGGWYWHISLNNYGYHIVNEGHTTLILCGHLYATLVHIYVKAQLTTTSKSFYCYICAEKQRGLPNCRCTIHLMHIYGECICIYEPHIKLLAFTMWPAVLYTWCPHLCQQHCQFVYCIGWVCLWDKSAEKYMVNNLLITFIHLINVSSFILLYLCIHSLFSSFISFHSFIHWLLLFLFIHSFLTLSHSIYSYTQSFLPSSHSIPLSIYSYVISFHSFIQSLCFLYFIPFIHSFLASFISFHSFIDSLLSSFTSFHLPETVGLKWGQYRRILKCETTPRSNFYGSIL